MPKRVRDVGRGDHEGRPLAAGNPDPEPVADEIFAEVFHRGIGDDAAVLDLRIDQIDHAGF